MQTLRRSEHHPPNRNTCSKRGKPEGTHEIWSVNEDAWIPSDRFVLAKHMMGRSSVKEIHDRVVDGPLGE